MRICLAIWLVFITLHHTLAQTEKKINLDKVEVDGYQLKVHRATSPIILDGIPNESAWLAADSAKSFYQNYPYDTGYAISKTTVWVLYDEENLYIGVRAQSPKLGKWIAQSLNRDWSVRDSDGLQVTIDSYNDRTNGFAFGLSPYNAQREGILANGGNDGVSTAWDNKWYSATKRYDTYWTGEMRIPFISMRYGSNLKEWRINFTRTDYKANEMSTWVPLYRIYNNAALAYTGRLIWDEPHAKKGSGTSLIPFVAGNYNRTYVGTPPPTRSPLDAGLDAKIPLSSAVNLDLTINPDFSQVEVDRQQTNLSRFELFFPERRNFFLENSDILATLGSDNVRPFFSRRIGIAFDSTTQLFVQNPILMGARVSGRLNSNYRLAALTMQTPLQTQYRTAMQNYSAVALQRTVFGRSFVTGFLTNRNSFGTGTQLDWLPSNTDFNRVAGLEYNLASSDNRWIGKFLAHNSFGSQALPDQQVLSSRLSYNARLWSIGGSAENVGSNYRSDIGFVPRRGYTRFATNAYYTFLQKSGPIYAVSISNNNSGFWMPGLGNTDLSNSARVSLSFRNTAFIDMGGDRIFVRLFAPFDPSGRGDRNNALATGSSYLNYSISSSVGTDFRKKISYTGSIAYGQFYVGHLLSQSGDINIRQIPFGILTLNYTYNRLWLPGPWGNNELWLAGARLNLTFTTNLFWRINTQYNTQNNNLNINTTLQWRYAPASDFFIAYTDNYEATTLNHRNQAILLKLTYWLNM